ncbi:MAG: hypothetical protein K9M80_05345, partial [Candidatus Marinimicrobia bacterium]|nr:hypothetical protein [Candidatus Neomarinimicrobiota bacterium]
MKIKLMNKFKNIILFRYCFGLIALLLFGIPVVILANSFQKSLSQYSHQVWQSHNGLSQTGISSIVQGKDGYIWVAT